MKKFWLIYGQINSGPLTRYETYRDAEDQAKRQAAVPPYNEFIILEAIATTKQPVPAIDVVKLS